MIDLLQIRQDIEGPSEDARFNAWMELYNSGEAVAFEEFRRILLEHDSPLKVLLARFLGRVAEERAVGFLVTLLEDSNSIVQAQAERSFERNRFEDKLKGLLPLVHSGSKEAQKFAIEKLTAGEMREVVDLLLELLPKASEALLENSLRGLRYFSHPKILEPILPYLKDSRENIRFRATLVAGALYGAGVSRAHAHLVAGLFDSSPEIRKGILWSLKMHPRKKDLDLLISISLKDPEPSVRRESILLFLFFPISKVITHLVQILVQEKDRSVGLCAEAVLLSYPTAFLLKGLEKIAHARDFKMGAKALLLIANFQRGSHSFFRYLVRGLNKTSREREKIPWIEALGQVDLPEAVPILEPFLKESPLLGYGAMASLLKIWNHFPEAVPVLKFLKDPQISPLFKQIILKQLLRKGNAAQPEELNDLLLEMLHHENLNIRYLAAQLLAVSRISIPLKPLVEVVLKETDPTLIRFLRESIASLLERHPESLKELLQYYRDNPSAILLLLSILMETKWYGERLLALALSLLEAPLSIHRTEYLKPFVLLLVSYISGHRIRLEDFLKGLGDLNEKEELLAMMVSHLNKEESLQFQLPLEQLEKWLALGTSKGQVAILDLLGLSSSEKALPLLVSVLCNPAFQTVHERAGLAARKLMGSGSVKNL